MSKNPWTFLRETKLFESAWIVLNDHLVLNPVQKEQQYAWVHFQNVAVGILALDEDDNIYLVGQWRYPLKEYSWEIPEGGSPVGQDTLYNAKKELMEEVGLSAKKWTKCFELCLSNSSTDEKAVVYLAEDLELGQKAPEETEVLETKKVPLQEAFKMVQRGEIKDAISVASIQYLILKKNNLLIR